MHSELIAKILDAGKVAAYEKMTLDKNHEKPDMRNYNFSKLAVHIRDELHELNQEICKTYSCEHFSEELLNSIRDEAGDIVAFASGIAAKCDLEINKIYLNKTSSLFDEN